MFCMEGKKEIFDEKYTNLEIEKNTRALVSSGILASYHIYSYLCLTETFITSLDY